MSVSVPATAATEQAKSEVASCEQEIFTIKAKLRNLGPVTPGASAAAGGGATNTTSSSSSTAAAAAETTTAAAAASATSATTKPTGSSGSGGSLGGSDSTLNSYEGNQLSLTWIEYKNESGDAVTAADALPELKLQLSSPVEEGTLTSLYKTPTPGESTQAPEGESSKAHTEIFVGIESSQAMLTIEAYQQQVGKTKTLVGASKAYDVSKLCKFDPMKQDEPYQVTTQIEVELSPPDENDKTNAKKMVVVLKTTFTPSRQDIREELYEYLNAATQKKAAAVEKLREAAMAAARESLLSSAPPGAGGSSSSAVTTTTTSPGGKTPTTAAIKPGFLNKSGGGGARGGPADGKKNEVPFYQVWYQRYLGPQSFLRQAVPIAKNYVLFGFTVVFLHFKGQLLALPPPV